VALQPTVTCSADVFLRSKPKTTDGKIVTASIGTIQTVIALPARSTQIRRMILRNMTLTRMMVPDMHLIQTTILAMALIRTMAFAMALPAPDIDAQGPWSSSHIG
jgi:hypothetical protein